MTLIKKLLVLILVLLIPTIVFGGRKYGSFETDDNGDIVMDTNSSATFVLCAFDTPKTWKCDHRTNDIASDISRARDALPETGGTIELATGNYIYKSRITMSKANVGIKGQGRSTKLVADTSLGSGALVYGIWVTANNVILEDFWLDGGEISNKNSVVKYLIHSVAGKTTIDGLTITNAGRDGTVFAGGSYDGLVTNTIYDKIYRNMGGDQSSAMEVEDGAKRITFKHNIVTNSATCMYPHVHNNSAPIEDIKYIDNTCIKGIGGYNSATVEVAGNALAGDSSVYFIRNSFYGTGLSASNGSSNRLYITARDNVFRDSVSHSILINVNTEAELTGNRIVRAGSSPGKFGIYLVGSTVLISGGSIKDGMDSGIYVSTAKANIDNIILKNNGTDTQELKVFGVSDVLISDSNIYGGIKFAAHSGIQKIKMTDNYVAGSVISWITQTGKLIFKGYQNEWDSLSLVGTREEYLDNNFIN
jgi:hypothetical protein